MIIWSDGIFMGFVHSATRRLAKRRLEAKFGEAKVGEAKVGAAKVFFFFWFELLFSKKQRSVSKII